IDWEGRQTDFEETGQQVEELETANHPKADALRRLVDGIDNAAKAGRFAQACSTLDQFLPKLKTIYQEFQKSQPAHAKSGDEPAEAQVDSEPALGAAPGNVGKDDPAQKQAEQDFNKLRTTLQPKLDDALVTAKRFDTLKSARKDLVRDSAKVEAA